MLLLHLSGCAKTMVEYHKRSAETICTAFHDHPENYSMTEAQYAQKQCNTVPQYNEDLKNSWISI